MSRGSVDTLNIDTIFVGNDEVSRLYIGDTLVWNPFSPEYLLTYYHPDTGDLP